MILEYSCENFRSIGEKITFSMIASSDNSLKENLIERNDLRILKEAIIYGGNGSGKSNFIDSIAFLQQLVISSHNFTSGAPINKFSHKSMLDKDTTYRIHFTNQGIRFVYGLSYNVKNVTEEYLYYYPNGKVSKIFDRKENNITYGDKFAKQLIGVEKDYLKENRLMLSCAQQYRNIPDITTAFLFFMNKIVIFSGEYDWILYSAETISKNKKLKQIFIDFLNNTNGSKKIKDIDAKIEYNTVNPTFLPPFISEEAKAKMVNTKIPVSSIKFDYGKFQLDLAEESEGVKKLFNIFCPLVDIVLNNKIFICDEFEAHLHPFLVKELINMFKNNAVEAQMISTTHDVNLLDLSLFRRDQIWFTEIKEKNLSTDLYSLAELKNVRKDESLIKNYNLGKYSGIPIINKDIQKELMEALKNE